MWPLIKFYAEGDGGGEPKVVDDPNLDNPDLDNQDDLDPRNLDDDEPSGDDKPKDEPAELDDAAILKAFESRGVKSDSLDKIVAVFNDNPALAKKHQSLTGTMKAVRAKLEADGVDPDVFLGEAVSGYDGRKPSKSKKAEPAPAVLQRYKPEQLEALGEAIKHFTGGGKAIEEKLEEMMPAIISAVTGHLDFTAFAESKGEDTDELQEKLQKIASKHGITGRGKETLALLYELAEKELKGAVEDLSGNEGGVHTTKVIGSPPPKGRDRKGVGTEKKKPQTDADWEKEAKERGVTE